MSSTASTPAAKASWFENFKTFTVEPADLKKDDETYFASDGMGGGSETEKKHVERFRENWKSFFPHYDLPADTLMSMWAEVLRLSAELSNTNQMCYAVHPHFEETRALWKGETTTEARSLGFMLEALPDWKAWDGSEMDAGKMDITYLLVDIPVRWVSVAETKIRHYPEGFFGPESPAQDRKSRSSTAELTVDWDKLPVQQRTRLYDEGEKTTGSSGMPIVKRKR